MDTEVRRTHRPFGGYDAVRSSRIDTELCLVDKGTPGGEYLRRFWQPIAMSSDLGALPVAIKILGEELVLFRDKSGDVGLLHRYCSHRGTSLELGLIVDHGLRCAYHGWHFAVDGQILDAPGETRPGTIAKQLCQGAYPTRELKGLVFAYMGPIDEMPPFPNYDFMDFAGEEYVPFIWHNPCNWVQLRENTQDPIHLTFLHSMFSIKQFGDYAYDLPHIAAHTTPIGQITTSVRRVHDVYYCRVNELIMPNIARVPDGFALNEAIPANKAGHPGEQRKTAGLRYKRQIPATHGLGLTTWIVPNDNTNAMHMGWLHLPEGDDPDARQHQIVQISFGQTGERTAEARRLNPGDWDAWVAQGPIASRDNDNLTAADAGIALFRRQLREGIRAVAAGKTPKGLHRDTAKIATYGFALTRQAPPMGSAAEEAERKEAYERDATAEILDNRMAHRPAGPRTRVSSVIAPVLAADPASAVAMTGGDRTRAIIQRMEALPVTSLHIRARLGVGAATFFDGFDVLTIGSALPVLVSQWHLSPREIGYVISSGFVGQLLGSLIFPAIADRFGRLRATTWSVAIFGLMSLLCALAGNYTLLVVFRLVQGIGLGGELPVAATYINEIARAEGRGRFVIFYEIIFPIGLFASTLLGLWIVPAFGWQVMFALAGVPAVLALLLRYLLPESPRWLAANGRFAEAEAAVARFERAVKPGQAPRPTAPPRSLVIIEHKLRWGELFEPAYLRRTLVAWTIWFAGGFLSNALTTWFPTIYRTMFHLSVADALRYGVATTLGGVIGSAICALVIDHVGRRAWMSVAFAGCAVCFFSILTVQTLTAEIVMLFVAVSFGFVSTAFITAYAYTPEIYPTRMRAYGCGVASAILRLAGAIAPTLIGILVADYSLNSVFVAMGVVALVASVVVGLFAVETKGRVLEDISA